MAQQETKLCKHCKMEIPTGAKICPHCRKKQGGVLKWVLIVLAVIAVAGAAAGKGGSGPETKQAGTPAASASGSPAEKKSDKKEPEKESEKESEVQIAYISVTADELSDALEKNAMKAQNDYKGQYLEVTGKLGTIDSSGKYIAVKSNKDFDFTNIQCYLKTEEHKQVIMEMSQDDVITVRGYCKDVGELIGYQLDMEEVMAQ